MLKINKQQDKETLEISGNLNAEDASLVWKQIVQYMDKASAKKVCIQLIQAEEIDHVGIALLAEVSSKYSVTVLGLKDEQRQQMEQIQALKKNIETSQPTSFSWIEKIGITAENAVKELHINLQYIGEIAYHISVTFLNPKKLRWLDVWKTMEKSGPNALPIILLLGFLMGLIMAFQSAIPLERFGAVIYVANLVGISLTRELAPLLVSIILAGRTASAFAAEIGTMKINQEIDALTTMGLKPVLFLALPRILAVTCMTPILNLFMILAGMLGCFLFMHSIGYGWDIFIRQIEGAVKMNDLLGGTFKAFVFGFLIACIGCIQGLKTKIGATAVGDATTQAVVSCIVMIVVVDGIFAAIYYILGV